MAEKYLRDVTALMARLGPRLPWGCVLKLEHFFGGAAVYAGANICITFTPAGLALKLPEEARDALTADGATPLRYFPKAPVKKEYVVVPRTILADEPRLKPWAEAAIAYAAGAYPAK